MVKEYKEHLWRELDKLHARNELSKTVNADYFEPGMMEFLSESEGVYDKETGIMLLRFEARGTRYGDRTELIEKMSVGEYVQLIREPDNPFNSNNFMILNKKDQNIGNMPAELCNVIAPLYDKGCITFTSSVASFVEPVTKRSRHARQGVLFVELKAEVH